MTDKLPQNLRALFAPRPPLKYLPPSDLAQEERHTSHIGGIAQWLPQLQEKKEIAHKSETGELTKADEDFEPPPTLSTLEKSNNQKQEKIDHHTWMTTEGVTKLYKPAENPQIRGDPFRTLFISRLSYDVDTKDLEREFGRYGPIERTRIVVDGGQRWAEMAARGVDMAKVSKKKRKGASRGYAFIIFEKEEDMKGSSAILLHFETFNSYAHSCLQRNGWSHNQRPSHLSRR